uniref:Uncharacterized protein n=1 Tax=Solanum lycopersicum TaxID=4081 RepID=A0A3Q7F0T8_SOLLC
MVPRGWGGGVSGHNSASRSKGGVSGTGCVCLRARRCLEVGGREVWGGWSQERWCLEVVSGHDDNSRPRGGGGGSGLRGGCLGVRWCPEALEEEMRGGGGLEAGE